MRRRQAEPQGSRIESLRTHLIEINWLCRNTGLADLALSEELFYTGGALVWEFRFADGKRYRMTVEEVKREDAK